VLLHRKDNQILVTKEVHPGVQRRFPGNSPSGSANRGPESLMLAIKGRACNKLIRTQLGGAIGAAFTGVHADATDFPLINLTY